MYPLCSAHHNIIGPNHLILLIAWYEDLTSKVGTSSSAMLDIKKISLAGLSRVIRWISLRFLYTFAPLCSLYYSAVSAELKSHWSTSLSSSRPSSLLTTKCTGQAKKLMSWKHLPQFMAMKTVHTISRMQQQASQQFFGTEKLAGWAHSWEPN